MITRLLGAGLLIWAPAAYAGGGASLVEVGGGLVGGGLIGLGIYFMNYADDEQTGIPLLVLGLAVSAAAPPILSIALYNAVKKPKEADTSALTVAPSITALTPHGRDGAPTLAYGLAMSF